ncbi:hypothetical protein EDB86DRAFT_2825996 [Lactarius hatsudake]|nr:hypothetical protein EDB86DRAFT_2825996 [Lactarius hatsudake]
MTLPQAEAELSSHLGNHYKYEDWSLAFDVVMKAKGDTVEAQKAVQQMSVVCDRPKLTIWIPAAQPPQLVATEKELMAAVGELRKRNWAFGELPTVEELTDPVQEREVSEDSPYAFPGGDKDIVGQVLHEGRVQHGEVVEVEDNDDEDDDPDAHVT